jgi:hypothetical protein
MKNFRSLIDITPWDKNGYSFWGLNRKQAKALAMFFIVIGTLLAVPPVVPDPMDAVSIGVATYLQAKHNIPLETTLLLMYTVVAWTILLIGIWIYPTDSRRMLGGYIRKAKMGIRKILSDPLLLFLAGGVFYVFFKWYKENIDLTNVTFDLSGLTALITQPSQNTVIFMLILIGAIIIIKKNR